MTKILCYNEDCCDANGYDNVINHPDAIVLEVDADASTIQRMICAVNYISQSELQQMFPIKDFTRVYWALIENEFVDILEPLRQSFRYVR